MKIACPRCEQDWIKKVHIGITQKNVYLCYECEATWFCEDSIELATFVQLHDYLGRKQISAHSKSTYDTFVDDKNWGKDILST